MGGRVYDPDLGRFLSPDPFIQQVGNQQNFNRYSYVLNNPLSYTDPSGFFFKSLFKAIGKLVKGGGKIINGIIRGVSQAINKITGGNKFLNTVIAVAAAAYTGGLAAQSYITASTTVTVQSAAVAGGVTTVSVSVSSAAATTAQIIGGAVGGAVAGAILGGDLKSTLTGAVTGAAFAGSGAYFGNKWNIQRVLLDGTIGGVSSKAQGGSFADGFKISAAVSTLSWGAQKMRELTVAQSKIDPRNASGESVGYQGDGFKAGGGRFDASKASEYLKTPGSPLGGWQGGQGYLLGIPYPPGSFLDRLVESYAGVHDYLNSWYWYNASGNIRQGLSTAARWFGEGLNAINVPVATPFVLSSATQPYTSSYISGINQDEE